MTRNFLCTTRFIHILRQVDIQTQRYTLLAEVVQNSISILYSHWSPRVYYNKIYYSRSRDFMFK